MDILPTAPILIQLSRVATILFVACLLIFMSRHYKKASTTLARLWFVFWAALLGQYSISVVATALASRAEAWFLIPASLLDLIQLTAIVIVAEVASGLWRRDVGEPNSLILVAFGAGAIGAVVAYFAIQEPSGLWRDSIQSLFGFTAVSWFVVRWVSIVPTRLLYLSLPMLLYAGIYLLAFGADPNSEDARRLILSLINLAGLACFAFACHFTLTRGGEPSLVKALPVQPSIRDGYFGAASTSDDPDDIHKDSSAEKVDGPESVDAVLRLDNLYALLFLAWHYRSGRYAVLALTGSAVALALAALQILPKLSWPP